MAIDQDGFIVTTLERISGKLDKHDEKLETVQQEVGKFVVIFERLANLDEKHEARYSSLKEIVDRNNKLVHKRIDNEITIRDEKIDLAIENRTTETDAIKEWMKDLNGFVFMLKHPKISFLCIAGLYIFAIKDIRDPVLKMIGLL